MLNKLKTKIENKMKNTILNWAWQRMLTKNPTFEKKIIKWGVIILAIMIGVYFVPDTFVSLAKYKAIVHQYDGGAMLLILGVLTKAQTGTADTSLISPEVKDAIIKEAQTLAEKKN